MIIIVQDHSPKQTCNTLIPQTVQKKKKLPTTYSSKLTVGLSIEPLQARCPRISFHLVSELLMVALANVAVPARLIVMDVGIEVLNWKEMEA